MGLADLHIHSIYSPDGIPSIPAVLKHVAEKTDLDVIAITDHNSMRGVREALELAPAYGVEVIPGCEVSTAEGHLLALYSQRPLPAGRPLIDTLCQVGDAGGLCIAPHPMARGCSSLHTDAIERALQHPDAGRILVGVEVFNGGLVYTRRTRAVAELAARWPVAQVGNSDSHMLPTIGQGTTVFPGKSAADLRAALLARATQAQPAQGLGMLAALRAYVPAFFLRVLGWGLWNPAPDAPIRYARMRHFMAYSQAWPRL